MAPKLYLVRHAQGEHNATVGPPLVPFTITDTPQAKLYNPRPHPNR